MREAENDKPAGRKWTFRIANNQKKRKISKTGIRKVLAGIFGELSSSHLPSTICEVSVVMTGDDEIRDLNKHYRGKDKATDVLSFSQLEGAETPLAQSLGDIVISVQYAEREAKKRGIPLHEELLRLIAHGVLHLLGFEHEGVSPATRRRMKRQEDKLGLALKKASRQILG